MTVALAMANPPDGIPARKAKNVKDLIARFERVIADDPEAPISKYCARRLDPLRKALARHEAAAR